jgi:hypothetical protein
MRAGKRVGGDLFLPGETFLGGRGNKEVDILGGHPNFRWVRLHWSGDRDPGSLRLHGGDFRVLEALDASEHGQNIEVPDAHVAEKRVSPAFVEKKTNCEKVPPLIRIQGSSANPGTSFLPVR